ncbi:hypothetical protein [Sporosarcina sp. ZBG7A]|uniref:hypothetical protein n=1 Tax=Sporosarcina sp. ZBG7A TaxID=1582223 RepID=UPI00068BAB79|nr:hypothetical protein [Sporosarcina sp. ZBG7A]
MKASDKLSQKTMRDSGKILVAQQHMLTNANRVIDRAQADIQQLSSLNDAHSQSLDELLAMAERFTFNGQLDAEMNAFQPASLEFEKLPEGDTERIDTIDLNDVDSWEAYLAATDAYIQRHDVVLQADPFRQLMTDREQAELKRTIQEDYKMAVPKCDKYDYAIAACCGAAAGLIDSFFVGMPATSKLGGWTDAQTDTLVKKFSQYVWHSDKKNGANLRKEPDTIAGAIGYLERRFKVNYDARYASDLKTGGLDLNMRPSDHHLKSLGHSPDLVGLFFSILDQFTGKASFIAEGRIMRIEPVEGTEKFELKGGSFLGKLFAGFSNWLGHLLSDAAGSSGTRGHEDGRRGSGIPIPFFSLFQLCDFGAITVNGKKKTFAEFSTAIFEAGYDARFGATMAIPVAFNELAIRLAWSLKSKLYHKRTWKDSLPIGSKPELRRMLSVGHGTLCIVDAADAAIRSSGNALLFGLHINLAAWSRFGLISLLEIRALYKEKGTDLLALEADVQKEWERL